VHGNDISISITATMILQSTLAALVVSMMTVMSIGT
jgi:hypothetical protein